MATFLAIGIIFLFTTKTQAQMEEAYKLANEMVRERLNREGEENIKILDELKKNDVIVVNGTYDHIARVLQSLKIPFAGIDHHQLMDAKLEPHQTIFVNCASSFPPEAARKLATFVAEGGQLITTDWALKNVIEVAFPNTIAYNNKPTADEVVRIEALDKQDSVITGFLDEKADPVWWLEGSSYPIEILDKEKVKVLIRSKELGEKYGAESVVVRFPHGKGLVYHMISHFYLQRTETRDAKQATKAADYFTDKGASKESIKRAEASSVSYGEIQSANTSADFVSRIIIKQKKKTK
ncbi:hypothetical protein DQQ10_24815 [Pseudochryseolinea flava]|uniref:Uncharacterized protein n=2 Tax=Pseudochryseolinea flava TaxID=2059302 RepID=A0A364XVQ8_9BACT|nr:hypothetical protein DQQ10_24815 [Pseudochryseolinea flava]